MADATDRVWSFRWGCCNALRNTGYGALQIHKLHFAIGHIPKKLKPHQLYKRMTNLFKRRKNRNFEKKTKIDRIMREVSRQVKKIQTEQGATPGCCDDKSVEVPQRREPELFRRHKIKHENLKAQARYIQKLRDQGTKSEGKTK